MNETDEHQGCLDRIVKYEKKFKRALDLVRCIGGGGVELGLLHGDEKSRDKIVAAVGQILKAASALDLAISDAMTEQSGKQQSPAPREKEREE